MPDVRSSLNNVRDWVQTPKPARITPVHRIFPGVVICLIGLGKGRIPRRELPGLRLIPPRAQVVEAARAGRGVRVLAGVAERRRRSAKGEVAEGVIAVV